MSRKGKPSPLVIDTAEQFIWNFIEEARKDRGYTIPQLCEVIEISHVTYNRYKKRETSIELKTLLAILGVLDIRPYFVPKELDDNDQMHFMDFN